MPQNSPHCKVLEIQFYMEHGQLQFFLETNYLEAIDKKVRILRLTYLEDVGTQ